MSFREIKPGKSRSNSEETRKKIRVSFPEIRDNQKHVCGHSMILYIGKDVAEQIGIHEADRVKFFVDSHNPRIWFIKVSDDESGYKVLDVLKKDTGKGTGALRIQLTWKEFKPSEEEKSIRTVKHEIYEGGIRVFI